MKCVQQLHQQMTIINAVNESNVVIKIPSNLVEYKTVQAPTPDSFKEVFGPDKDPYKVLRIQKNLTKYVAHLTNEPLEGIISNAQLDKYIAENVKDVLFAYHVKHVIEHNRKLERVLKTADVSELQDFSCKVKRENYEIVFEKDSKLFNLMGLSGVVKQMEVPYKYKALLIEPIGLDAMQQSYNAGNFFKQKEYSCLVHAYDKSGFFDDIKISTPIGSSFNPYKLYNRTRKLYAYKVLSTAIKEVVKLGGKVVLYTSGKLVVVLNNHHIVEDGAELLLTTTLDNCMITKI